MTSSQIPAPIKPWVIPLLTGIVGLLLGSLITIGIVALGSANHSGSKPKKATASHASIVSADKRYDAALFDCGVETSKAVVLDKGTAILRVTSQSLDGSKPGLTLDTATCIPNSLGASTEVIDQMSNAQAEAAKHAVSLKGLTMIWLSRGDGGIDIVVTPTASS